MRIRSFAHKGLKRLYLADDPSGLPPDAVDKLRKMLTFLQDIEDEGSRRGFWSLHVTRNWRLTFGIDVSEGEVFDVNLEDYH